MFVGPIGKLCAIMTHCLLTQTNMTIDKIIEFLKNDIRGLIILAIVTSLISALLYDFGKKIYVRIIYFFRKKILFKELEGYFHRIGIGYASGFSIDSTYKQIMITGDMIIQIILQIFKIIISFLIFISLSILVGQPYNWIFVILLSIILTWQYKSLKKYLELYDTIEEKVFGKEFMEKKEAYFKKMISEKFKLKSNSKPRDNQEE